MKRSSGIVVLVCLIIGRCPQLLADEVQNTWQEVKGQNFVIYHRPEVPDDFVQTTMDTAEEEFKRVSDNMGLSNNYWGPSKQIKIYIYRDKGDYVKDGGQAIWSHGAAFAQAKTIKIYPEASGFFDTLLPHELGHIIFRDYVGFDTIIPLWFEEGVAIYQEKAKRLGANDAVKAALQNDQFISLSKLTGVQLYKNSNDQIVDLFYNESASVVYYLISDLGEQEFYMFCAELKSGTSFQDALHKVYLRFKTTDDLNKGWVGYLQG
jgi:hypothetical protein